jgi:CheY-like chemotaxis protein
MNPIRDQARPAHILLVEDNAGDVLLTRKAFQNSKIANTIDVATDGDIAMRYLRREGEFADARLPDLILLDLNLPTKDGREVLRDIKADDGLKHIPVVILTSSRAELDIVKTYNLHANSYLIKPVNLEKFTEIVETIEHYWFTLVVLPGKGGPVPAS